MMAASFALWCLGHNRKGNAIMPDPTKQTISATEVPALYNASPYLTRWMLWQKFANGLNIEKGADSHMAWGTILQPVILQEVAKQRKLEVIPNDQDTYARRGLVGCTRDAVVICPDRGPGAVEVKCCFDFKTWATTWGNGERVPRHHELQLQTQMYVGSDDRSYEWGMVAVFVAAAAEIRYFERRPVLGIWNRLEHDAQTFFHQVRNGLEPDPFGAECESPFLSQVYPTRPESVLDLSQDPDHVKTSADVSMYRDFKESANGSGRVAEEKRLKLLALAKGHQLVKLPCGVTYRVQKSGKGWTIVPYIPETLEAPPPPRGETLLAAG